MGILENAISFAANMPELCGKAAIYPVGGRPLSGTLWRVEGSETSSKNFGKGRHFICLTLMRT